ncbi:hypothetical protein AC249_AIPGENE16794 [Paramuricea clavata]|uniref:Uncharacterized protein n=1 Tax=Paramuricea clavata TaxID=317549 RepID=A0A6S7JBB0_PARCT|nr:hypothetical protein AC249_AIPGENE16794 [Paramuricea clavata]
MPPTSDAPGSNTMKEMHEIKNHGHHFNKIDGERDEYGYYYCQHGCGYVFSTKATRTKHEERTHGSVAAPVNDTESVDDDCSEQDYLYNYHTAKLTYGLLLLEFNDAVKEGDGERLFKVYKLAMLFYRKYGHFKYAYAVLLYSSQIKAILSESEACDLKWNRFHNKFGGKGRNIPLDLKKEQQNKVLKTMWKGLGSNLSEQSASRVAKALDSIEDLMSSIDTDCRLEKRQGRHSKKDPEESVTQILGDLMKKQVFLLTPGRRRSQIVSKI